MSKPCVYRFRIFSFVITSLCIHHISAQVEQLIFDNKDLHSVILTLEQESAFIFNYEPSQLKEYYYSGVVNLNEPQQAINNILYNSPFVSEQDAGTVLIYLPEAQQYQVCGTLMDATTDEPLVAASVILDDTTTGVQSDVNGAFDMIVNGYKNQTISISYIGYETQSIMLQELPINDCRDYRLRIDDDLLGQEIVVTDYILDGITEGADYSGYTLDYQRLSKYQSNVEHDILKTALLLPGIHSLDESATNLQIRGGSPDQNLILWEGNTLYHSGHLFGMISAINPFSVNEVNIFKNAYDPSYDNRVGGIIDISLTDSIATGTHGSVGSTLTEAHFNVELPIISEKLSILFGGRHSISSFYNSPPLQTYGTKVFQYSKIDDQSADAEEGFINAEQSLQFDDWNAKLLYRPSKRISIKAGIYNNKQDFQYKLSYPSDPFNTLDQMSVKTEAIHANIDYTITDKWSSTISIQQSKYKSTYDYIEEEEGLFLTENYQFNDIDDQSVKWSTNFKYSPNLKLNAGYDYNVKRINYDVINVSTYLPNYMDKDQEEGRFHNIFASLDYAKNNFSLNGGMRSTLNTEKDKWVFAPRLSMQYAINSQLKLKVESGIFHQFINQLKDLGTNVLQVDNPIWIINSGAEELSQRAQKVSGGFIYQDNGWLLDVEGYYNKIDGLSTQAPLFNLVVVDEFSQGESTASGIDMLLKKRWKSFNVWINYSWSHTDYFFPEISETPFAAPNDIRHIVSVVGTYKYKNLNIALSTHYHSGLPYTQPIGVFDYYDEETESTLYLVDYVDTSNERLREYLRFDLNLNYRPRISVLGKVQPEISLSVINLLNRENVFAREHYLDYQEEIEPPKLAFINKVLLERTPLLLVRFYW